MEIEKIKDVKGDIAWNLMNLRYERNLTQLQLSKKSGVPRSTIAYIETGAGNPSLDNLMKVADALQVSLIEMLNPPPKAFKYYSLGNMPVQKRNQGLIYKLLPDPIPGMEIDRIEIDPRGIITGAPHIPGSREYLICIEGQIEVRTEQSFDLVHKGDLVAFNGNQKHTYNNAWGEKRAVGISVVVLPRSL